VKHLHRGQRSYTCTAANDRTRTGTNSTPAANCLRRGRPHRSPTNPTRLTRGESPASRPARTDQRPPHDGDADVVADNARVEVPRRRPRRGRPVPHREPASFSNLHRSETIAAVDPQTAVRDQSRHRIECSTAAIHSKVDSVAGRPRRRCAGRVVVALTTSSLRRPRRCCADHVVVESKPSPRCPSRRRAARVAALAPPFSSSFSVVLPRDSHTKRTPPTGPRTGTNAPALGGSQANDNPFRRVFPPSSRS